MAEPEDSVTTAWSVEIGRLSLGSWITCEGLGIELVMEQREEGGNNGFVWQLPTRVKYTNVKLSRPICAETTKVVDWLTSMVRKAEPQTGRIRALTAEGKPVAVWNLQGVMPIRWSGPSMSADSPKTATETIELVHHGFTVGKE